MRRVISLAVLIILPLASGLLVGIEAPEELEQEFGRELVIQSTEQPWEQTMWDGLKNKELTPLRLLTPNSLLVWDSDNSNYDISGTIIETMIPAEWRGDSIDSQTYEGYLWIVFEPNLPKVAAQNLILWFGGHGVEMNNDLGAYGKVIPHRELVDTNSISISIDTILNLDGILWIEPKLDTESRNVQASGLMGDGTITQPIQWSLGLNGTGVVLGIADSGVDYDHACFRNATSAGSYGSDGINSTEGVGQFGPMHRKILFLNDSIDSADTMGHINFRHGTHTAGSLACFDVYDYRDGNIPGNASAMAHNAKIIVQDIVSAEGWVPPDNVSELLSEAALLGGIIHSNSWGDDTSEYTARSAEFDAWSVQMPWSLSIIAPGNTGGAMLEPANGRNVVAIGASTKAQSFELWPSSSIGPTQSGTYGIFALAPGVSIQSARADGISDSYNNDLRSSSGTSMSTPSAASFAGVIQQMVQDGWLMGANEKVTAVNISNISPGWANLNDNSVILGEGFVPSGALLKSILAIATTHISDSANYTKRNNESGFGVLNLSELVDVGSILSDVRFNDVSPSDDVWIHDSFRLDEITPAQWLDGRSDGQSALDDLIGLPWDGSGAAGPFLATGQNWTKRLVPNGEDITITMSFPSSPEPYLVEDMQLIAHTSNGYFAIGEAFDGDGFSTWHNSNVSIDDIQLFPNKNETTVGIEFSSTDLQDIEWIDLEVRARYISPSENPGYTGIGGDRVGFALAAKGVVRDSLNWEDSDSDGLANIEDICPNENPQEWDVDNDGCVDDNDGDGIKDNIDMCINQNSSGFDLDQNGCIDDTDGDGVGNNLDRCDTLIISSSYPVDYEGCRPKDNPPEIRQVIVTGVDNSVWGGEIIVSWAVEDLDGDLFKTGARIMLHQNENESSYFPIADCNYETSVGMVNEFLCSWKVPDDLPLFDIKEKQMHIQIHSQSLNQSPEGLNSPYYFDVPSNFTVEWENPLFEPEEKKGVKDEDWSVTQRRVLLWGIVGLIGIFIFMARIWSTNIENIKIKSGDYGKKIISPFNYAEYDNESE